MSAQESVSILIDNLIQQREKARGIAVKLEGENAFLTARVRELERVLAGLLDGVNARELAK